MRAWSVLPWIPFVGLALWLGLVARRAPEVADEATLAALIVLFVPLVAVPLALPLTARKHRSEATGLSRQLRRFKAAALLGALGGLGLCAGALLPDPGRAAAIALALPWLACTVLAALHGAARLLARGRQGLSELAIDAGLLCLPGGALWLLVYRGDLALGGFGGLAALLTAAHFHAAGFGALTMVGLLGRGLAEAGMPRARRLHAPVAALLLLAFPLLAAGIGAGVRALELAGAALYTLGLPALALLQLAAAIGLRGRPLLLRLLLALSAAGLLVSTAFAARYAVQGFYGAAVPIATMLRMHGLVNALGFLGLGLLAWSRLQPAALAGAAGVPFSRLRSPGRVGADFFAAHAPTAAPAPAGLVDTLAVFDRPGFVSAAVHPEVRAFYEATERFTLTVAARWRFPFRLAGRAWHRFGRAIGQLMLPTGDAAPRDMPSRIVAVEADADGRPNVRGWVRQLGRGGPPVYVAAYATHRDPAGQTYMNIAFPTPWSNLASILRIDHDPARPGGVVLTTCSVGQDDRGDQGVYLATALGAARLPMNETIDVWAEASGDGTVLRARHVLWLLGLRYLELDYAIRRAK